MKKVVYTSNAGSYDSFEEPSYRINGWDYIVFSNDLILPKDSIWEVRPIPYPGNNNIILSRFSKINPHLVLSDYDISLYIDSNITILDDKIENRIEKIINSEALLSIAKHPLRDCIYDEARVCIENGLDSKSQILKQLSFYEQNGFPHHFGLHENNIILRKHNHPEMISLAEAWWQLFLKYSKRDQLSLAYVLWKSNVNCEPLFEDGFDVRNNQSFSYSHHQRSLKQKIEQRIKRVLRKKFC